MKKPKGKDRLWRKIGLKLLIFRRKLEIALDLDITQEKFGEMFGGYTKREIQTYERGDVEIPAKIFYLIAQAGFSLDEVIGEREITLPNNFDAKQLEGKRVNAGDLPL